MKEYIVAVPEHLAGDLFEGDPELIRCKDCKHYCNENENYISDEGFATTKCIFMPSAAENNFCSRAERKEE